MDIQKLNQELSSILRKRTNTASLSEWRKKAQESDVPLFDYRFDHVLRVVRTAHRLAKLTGADEEIVVAAAWLHDIAKPSAVYPVERHADKSAKIAEEILRDIGFPEEKIPRVIEAVEKHAGLVNYDTVEPLEAAVVWDADKLVKIGAIGIVHSVMLQPILFPGQSILGVMENLIKFIPLAEKIVKSFNTSYAKKAGEARIKSLKEFAASLKKELELYDLE